MAILRIKTLDTETTLYDWSISLLKLIINSQRKYKGNKCLMSVWKSNEKLLIFAPFISLSKIILFEKKYQVFDTVFH